MIDKFEAFVSTYDMSVDKIKLKYLHSIEVMKLSEKYSKLLGFSSYDIELAKVIGLLHDYGRFEQWKRYKTFVDAKSIDHADYSVDMLFRLGNIKDYWSNEEDYPLIEFAIRNHNKFVVEESSNERYLLFAKFIRDMDKIDIMRLCSNNIISSDGTDDLEVSDRVLKEFFNHKTIKYSPSDNKLDAVVIRFALIFDINNMGCLEELKDIYTNYYLSLNNTKLKYIYDEVIKYIESKGY